MHHYKYGVAYLSGQFSEISNAAWQGMVLQQLLKWSRVAQRSPDPTDVWRPELEAVGNNTPHAIISHTTLEWPKNKPWRPAHCQIVGLHPRLKLCHGDPRFCMNFEVDMEWLMKCFDALKDRFWRRMYLTNPQIYHVSATCGGSVLGRSTLSAEFDVINSNGVTFGDVADKLEGAKLEWNGAGFDPLAGTEDANPLEVSDSGLLTLSAAFVLPTSSKWVVEAKAADAKQKAAARRKVVRLKVPVAALLKYQENGLSQITAGSETETGANDSNPLLGLVLRYPRTADVQPATPNVSAASRVLNTYELPEMILTRVTSFRSLIRVRRISSFWNHLIFPSTPLRQMLGLSPTPIRRAIQLHKNIALDPKDPEFWQVEYKKEHDGTRPAWQGYAGEPSLWTGPQRPNLPQLAIVTPHPWLTHILEHHKWFIVLKFNAWWLYRHFTWREGNFFREMQIAQPPVYKAELAPWSPYGRDGQLNPYTTVRSSRGITFGNLADALEGPGVEWNRVSAARPDYGADGDIVKVGEDAMMLLWIGYAVSARATWVVEAKAAAGSAGMEAACAAAAWRGPADLLDSIDQFTVS
ncbi:uncharacterized protein LTR77_005843 [Saxophila tyrrhenica]|uniref:F-box domain-containing protein n=1 Tax=Saxophila tyrrhenica TaxID=1690608 RepID=A0AAV9PDR2_9PEZI|nr:hypothetical protein LTR77_005843 [Saxophila tyrrhenica]